jgi:hypothetical protein
MAFMVTIATMSCFFMTETLVRSLFRYSDRATAIPISGIHRIRAKYPDIEIAVRADSGVNCASCYQLADAMDLKYAIGIASNEVLKRKTARCERAVSHLYVSKEIKQQHSISHHDQAGSWHKPQRCHSKIESTGKGLNVGHIISNLE